MGQARLEIRDADNDSLLAPMWDVDADGFQRNFDSIPPTGEKLNESGSGGFVLQEDHPAAEHVVPGNVVRVLSDSTPLYSFTITERDHTTISKRQADRTIRVKGDDLLERWADSTVDPWIAGRPISADRIWNWAAPRGFDDSSWSTTSYAQTRILEPKWPEAYPMAPLYAGQLWHHADSSSQPVESGLWRRTFTLASDADVAQFHAADDAANAWTNAVLLNRHGVVWPDTSGWQKTWREVPPYTAGTHVAAYEAFNFGGPAFFMASAFTVVNGVLDEPVYSTGDGFWKWYDPSGGPKPGFTAPEIVDMLLDEAQGRGELLGWTITVHGTHPNIEEFSVRVGTNYRDVLDQISTVHCDIAADPEGLELHLWPKGDRGSTTAVSVTSDQITVLQQIDTAEICNSVQGLWADGSRRISRTPHPILGVRSRSQQLGTFTDPVAVDNWLELYLDAWESPAPSIVGDIRDLTGAEAGVDYKVGDTLELNGVDVLCVGITWTVDRSGELVPHPEFDSLVGLRRRELTRSLDRMTSTFASPASASLLSSQPILLSGHPATQEWTWSWADDIEGALNEVDPEKPWQVKRAERTQRIYKIAIEIDAADLPDAFGDTKVRFLKNGTTINSLYDVTLTTAVARAETLVWGYEVITAADAIQPQVLDVGGSVGGGHVDGTITMGLADPV